jgi:hypothetical protein
MWLRGRGTIEAETELLAGYQNERSTEAALATPITALKERLANLWPVTMITLALGLTVAWTGLLMSLLWWGIEELI